MRRSSPLGAILARAIAMHAPTRGSFFIARVAVRGRSGWGHMPGTCGKRSSPRSWCLLASIIAIHGAAALRFACCLSSGHPAGVASAVEHRHVVRPPLRSASPDEAIAGALVSAQSALAACGAQAGDCAASLSALVDVCARIVGGRHGRDVRLLAISALQKVAADAVDLRLIVRACEEGVARQAGLEWEMLSMLRVACARTTDEVVLEVVMGLLPRMSRKMEGEERAEWLFESVAVASDLARRLRSSRAARAVASFVRHILGATPEAHGAVRFAAIEMLSACAATSLDSGTAQEVLGVLELSTGDGDGFSMAAAAPMLSAVASGVGAAELGRVVAICERLFPLPEALAALATASQRWALSLSPSLC